MPGKPSVDEQSKNVMKRMAQEKGVTVVRTQRATVTVKISRVVRDYITKSTTLNEPIDRTLRRLLKLKVQSGVFPQRTPRETPKTPPNTTTIKVTEEVREFVTSRAHWNESIDQTLRRLLGLKLNGVATASRRAK